MKNNKLQPVEIHDLFTYQFPGNLQYSPDGKFLAFEVAKAREKENDYNHSNIVLNPPPRVPEMYGSVIMMK